MSMVSNITGIIASPGQTIEKIAEKPYIEEAILIVGIVAILSGINAYIFSKIIIYDYGDIDLTDNYIINTITPILTIVMPIVVTMIVWLIATGVVHLISVALGGEGNFTQMLVIYGYAYIPILIGGVVSIVLMMFIEPITISLTDLSQDFTGGLDSNPYYQGLSIISYLMSLWSIGLLFMGVKYVHTLTSGKALIAVSIPILFLIGSIIATLFSKDLMNMFV
ncbi:MAG: YIP1 family protein [Methanosarcinales archaeon]|nr:YIP1 family protein [Methanosarcinales archaeon]